VPSTPAYADLAIYDDVLPSAASPFRTLEYQHYLDFFPSSVLISLEAWHFGFAHPGFGDLRANLPIEERLKGRILGPEAAPDFVPRLAYVTFLGNAQRLLPYFKARRIPFILQLYPGGSFEPNVEVSDRHLRQVVHSALCRKVITTQTLTREHLLQRIGCDPAKIEFIYGGVFDSRVGFDFARDKHLFGTHKETIDLCFVAHRYGDDMAQKGYDQFVEVARLLAVDDPRLCFHVVGDYSPDDVPLGDAMKRFIFHGRQPSAFFAEFYPRMDVILSPNQPARVKTGAFDGFPTGACMEAGFRGVLNCITDPLRLNVAFEDGRDVLLIDRDPSSTARRLASLFAKPDRLYALARANLERFREVFDVDRQLWARTRLITDELLRGEALITRPAAPLSTLDYVAGAAAQETERRHDALLVEYRKLVKALDEANVYGEQRHGTLLVEYRKLAKALDEANAYGEQRHDSLLVEYRKLATGFEAIDLRCNTLLVENRRLEAALMEANLHGDAPLTDDGKSEAARTLAVVGKIARRVLPDFVLRDRGRARP
jgi:glycosyltransferase involved in cell wall biosynthesis